MAAIPARCQPVPSCSSFALQQLMKPFPDFRRTKVLPLPQHFLQRLPSQLRGSNALLWSAPRAAPFPATGGCLSLNVLSPPQSRGKRRSLSSRSLTLCHQLPEEPPAPSRPPAGCSPVCFAAGPGGPPLPISCSQSRWFLQAEELERWKREGSRRERALRHRQRRGRLGSGPRGAGRAAAGGGRPVACAP